MNTVVLFLLRKIQIAILMTKKIIMSLISILSSPTKINMALKQSFKCSKVSLHFPKLCETFNFSIDILLLHIKLKD